MKQPNRSGKPEAFKLLSRLWIRLMHYLRKQLAQPDVSSLSDRQLRDIGLDRSGIDEQSERSVMAHYRDDLSDIGRRY